MQMDRVLLKYLALYERAASNKKLYPGSSGAITSKHNTHLRFAFFEIWFECVRIYGFTNYLYNVCYVFEGIGVVCEHEGEESVIYIGGICHCTAILFTKDRRV